MKKIRIAIKEVAENIGICSPTQLSEKTGINYRTCYNLWECRIKRIDFNTLEKLCETLDKSPNELLGYIELDDKISKV